MPEATSFYVQSNSADRFSIRTGGIADAETFADELGKLYSLDGTALANSTKQEIYRTMFNAESFRNKLLNVWTKRTNFRIVTLWSEDNLNGFIAGSSLPAGHDWWKIIREQFPSDFTAETGNRTLHINHFVVAEALRGKRLGKLLYTTFLHGRVEERVTLLSEPQLQPAYSIYLHWGYHKIGTSQPIPNEIDRDLLTIQLK